MAYNQVNQELYDIIKKLLKAEVITTELADELQQKVNSNEDNIKIKIDQLEKKVEYLNSSLNDLRKRYEEIHEKYMTAKDDLHLIYRTVSDKRIEHMDMESGWGL